MLSFDRAPQAVPVSPFKMLSTAIPSVGRQFGNEKSKGRTRTGAATDVVRAEFFYGNIYAYIDAGRV